jgi:hypothetical protein
MPVLVSVEMAFKLECKRRSSEAARSALRIGAFERDE